MIEKVTLKEMLIGLQSLTSKAQQHHAPILFPNRGILSDASARSKATLLYIGKPSLDLGLGVAPSPCIVI